MPVAPAQPISPSYRYFTADVLTGEILAEIPFSGVSYERAVKGAGAFRGSIPVIEDTEHLDLYESTTPGKTALYVVRNGVAVWGGIIWNRDYSVKNRVLSVAASEWISYLYHRRIWKTWNHEYEAVVTASDGYGTVTLTNGSTTALNGGTSVHLSFYEPTNFKYNDYYVVDSQEAPTTEGFFIDDIAKTATLTGYSRATNVATVYTSEVHNFSVGDNVVISGMPTALNGTQVITAVNTATGKAFSFANNASNTSFVADEGTAKRRIPDGTYTKVTVSVRTDTFDYVRGLLDGMFTDFTGIDFPNVYIEPGISYPIEVTNLQIQYGKAKIQTATPHNLAIGQAVQLQDVDKIVDGEVVVTDTPSETEFWFVSGGDKPSTAISVTEKNITSIEANNGVAKLYLTVGNIKVGQNIQVNLGGAFPGADDIFSGNYVVSDIDDSAGSWITYNIPSTSSVPLTALNKAMSAVGANSTPISKRRLSSNIVTITTPTPHGYSVGNSVDITNVNVDSEISEKFLDAANSRAIITTVKPHQLQIGDTAVISGLKDSSSVKSITQSGTAVTLKTTEPHNLRVGQSVTVANLIDPYQITAREIASGVAKLTTKINHNLQVGNIITVSDLYEPALIEYKTLNANTATIELVYPHNFQVNSKVTITGLTDAYKVVSKAYDIEKVVTLITDLAHNIGVGDEITVSGLGTPYDGKFTVFEVDDYTIRYDATETIEKYFKTLTAKKTPKNQIPWERPPTKANGWAVSNNSIFNGEHVIESVPTSETFTFRVSGHNMAKTAMLAGNEKKATGLSPLNGKWTVTATTATTVSFAVPGFVNQFSVPVAQPPAVKAGETQQPPAQVSAKSRHNGTRTITAISKDTIKFTSTGVSTIARDTTGSIQSTSIFNGTRTVTDVSPNTFEFTLAGKNNVYETTVTNKAFVQNRTIFNGTYTITAVTSTTFQYAKTHTNIELLGLPAGGSLKITPLIVVSTFGPYPKNADVGIEYSTRRQSGIDAPPPLYRGFELASVGDVLDSYADGLGGFEYRIDCTFDEEENRFRKTFVFIPLDYPDPPAEGEVSPITRFGADQLVFEYPGNVREVTLRESAENASTRFFAVGETDLGPDVGPPFSVAVADDMLNNTTDGKYREWPLLDDDEKIDGVDDESALYNYATRYLNEGRPPQAQFTVEVNGGLQPQIGTYNPGDWCSIIVNDSFLRQRLRTDLEPRDDVIVRKIDVIRVTVQDGTIAPEVVTLSLIPEWEVDKRAK